MFLRRMDEQGLDTPLWMARELDISQDEAVAVIEELEVDGFLEGKSEREWHEELTFIEQRMRLAGRGSSRHL
jgi:hypothetical protein